MTTEVWAVLDSDPAHGDALLAVFSTEERANDWSTRVGWRFHHSLVIERYPLDLEWAGATRREHHS